MKKIVVTLVFLTLNIITYGQDCLPNLKEYSTPFNKIEASSFKFLNNKLDNVSIVGLGEDTHGTSEFTKLPHQLLKHLVENQNFNLFIIEAGFGEVAFLNDYIQGGSDSLIATLETRISTWRYRTAEFVEMMEWLRTYNKTHGNKVVLYGMEMQYVKQEFNRVNQYLKKVGIENVETTFTKHLWDNITEEEKGDYYLAYKKLKKLFVENKEQFIKRTDKSSYTESFQHLEVIGQFIAAIHQNSEHMKNSFRDIYMAENVEWILRNNSANSKAFIWAHNAHMGDWVSNGITDVLGHQLKKRFGDSFFSIATDFGTGEFYAFPHNANEVGWKMQVFKFEKVLPNTFTFCLQNLGSPNVFLDLKKMKTNPSMKCEIEKDFAIMYGAGAQEWGTQTQTVPIGKAFDAIIYLDKTSKINFLR